MNRTGKGLRDCTKKYGLDGQDGDAEAGAGQEEAVPMHGLPRLFPTFPQQDGSVPQFLERRNPLKINDIHLFFPISPLSPALWLKVQALHSRGSGS